MKGVLVILKDLLMITYTSALPIVLGYIVWLLKTQIKNKSSEREATMIMLRMCLINLRDKYVERGHLTKQEFDDYDELYKLYHDGFGGNGLGTKMHEEVSALELKY